jgi:hypothetical protein
MSRFLLRNVVRDPRFAALRKKNESKVFLRPFIGGKPLPPGATRVLVLSDLTPVVLSEIEALVAVGCVEFLAVGRAGPSVDFAAVRKELGQLVVAPVATAVATEVVTEVVTEIAAAPTAVAPVEPAPAEPETPIAASEPAVEAAPEEPAVTVASSEPAAAKVWTREELEALKLTDLRDIVSAQGGKWASKNKAVLVDDILTAQGGV